MYPSTDYIYKVYDINRKFSSFRHCVWEKLAIKFNASSLPIPFIIVECPNHTSNSFHGEIWLYGKMDLDKGEGPVRIDFGLKFQVHLTKDFDHFLKT